MIKKELTSKRAKEIFNGLSKEKQTTFRLIWIDSFIPEWEKVTRELRMKG